MRLPYYVTSPIKFDEITGIGDCSIPPLERRYSNMRGIYIDETARKILEDRGDDIIYRFYDLGVPEDEGELSFGTSILYPGRVGTEFHMTNGHFHTIRNTAEVYFCQGGHGLMLMENPEGHVIYTEMCAGQAVYVPPRYAHRSINISSDQTLITFYVFRADAGHDYGSIKEKGFRKIAVADGDGWKLIDNPKWKGAKDD